MTSSPDPAWLEDIPALDTLGDPPVRRVNAHWSRIFHDSYLPHVVALGEAAQARALWQAVLRAWPTMPPQTKAESVTALLWQAAEVSPGMLEVFGSEALLSVIARCIDYHAGMFRGNRELALALALAPATWEAQLGWHTRTQLALEVHEANRLAEAPVPELRRRLYFEGKSLPEIDALIEAWSREWRDRDRSYEPDHRGRPKGTREAQPRKLSAAREKRYRDALDLRDSEWAALHEPDLVDPLQYDELREKFVNARKLARKHGYSGASST